MFFHFNKILLQKTVNKTLTNGILKNQFHTTTLKLGSKKQGQSKEKCSDIMPIMQPSCKVALITGGSEGVGFAIANNLLKCGAKGVAITGLDTCNGKEAVNCLNKAYGKNRAIFINSNLNCMIQLEETFKVTKEAFDNIDIVVNAAGICDGKRWESEIVTNVIGAIRTTLLAYKFVGKEGTGKGGIVINLCGIGGLEPIPAAPTLSCSFHGVVGFSRSFGGPSHFHRSGVRIVTLCTGITSTNFFKDINEKAMTETLCTELTAYIKGSKHQSPDVCGLAAVHLVRFADTGSVWCIDGSRLYHCKIPHWEKYSVMEAQYL